MVYGHIHGPFFFDPVIPVQTGIQKGVTEKIWLPLEFIPVKTGTGMRNRGGILNFCGRSSGRPQKYLKSEKEGEIYDPMGISD
ncbi:MAG: hypothetical protein A2157_19455 [Deltaproteobacteria bacterium RBG_16_47_11]|nr:MAG: hypothetical protein A2157_19455 [Deltaproteobacteria bacterium RBG_16_47_11]